MIKFLSKKLVIIAVTIIIVGGFGVYKFFIQENGPEYELVKVSKGTVIKEVSETGTVKVSEETNLSFKNGGRIEKIYFKVGDTVKTGQELAKLDTSQLSIELLEAQAALEVAQAKGEDAQISLESAKQNLKDVKNSAEESLNNAYQNALTVLDDCYLKAYNAYNVAYKIQQDYFTSSEMKSMEVIEQKYTIKLNLDRVESYVNNAKNDSRQENIDLNLSNVKELLETIDDSLKIIRDVTKSTTYYDIISDTDTASLDTQRTNIASAIASIVSSQQDISTVKINNETNINTAKAKVSELEKQLQTNGGISGLYQAQIKQAQAQISLLENQIQEAVLKSPSKGQITKVNKREGEIVQPTDSVISFLPAAPFQIEADIYEEDIVDVRAGNPVTISIPAFPEETLAGEVVSIDPAEKIIDGVVYYEITISFQETKEGIKPGMTADIVIEVGRKDNVLVVSKRAIKKIDGKRIVQIFQNNKIEEREIEIGLAGDNMVEVVSGLSEGEEILTGNK